MPIRKESTTSLISLSSNILQPLLLLASSLCFEGREPRSSGFERSVVFRRSWVRIPAPYTDGRKKYSHIFVVRIVMFVWKDENKRKRGRGWPIFQKSLSFEIKLSCFVLQRSQVRIGQLLRYILIASYCSVSYDVLKGHWLRIEQKYLR